MALLKVSLKEESACRLTEMSWSRWRESARAGANLQADGNVPEQVEKVSLETESRYRLTKMSRNRWKESAWRQSRGIG